MNLYKYNNRDKTTYLKYPCTVFDARSPFYEELQEYLEKGGQIDPWKTDKQLHADALSAKLRDLDEEKNKRSDNIVGTNNPRKKDKIISRAVKLLRRELKGNASTKNLAELDTMEVVDDLLDNLDAEFDAAEAWLSDPARSINQIQDYDVVIDPGWSTMEP